MGDKKKVPLPPSGFDEAFGKIEHFSYPLQAAAHRGHTGNAAGPYYDPADPGAPTPSRNDYLSNPPGPSWMNDGDLNPYMDGNDDSDYEIGDGTVHTHTSNDVAYGG